MQIYQNNAGAGSTTIAVDNDLAKGANHGVGSWSKRGWKSTGRGSDLHLVAFRDDDNEASIMTRHQCISPSHIMTGGRR